MDLNKISSGPGAINSKYLNALLEMRQELMEIENEVQIESVKLTALVAEKEGETAANAQYDLAASTRSSAIGQMVGAGISGASQAYGTFAGSHGSKIQEQNTILENTEAAQNALKSARPNPAIANHEAPSAARQNALQQQAGEKPVTESDSAKARLLDKLKGEGSGFKTKLTPEENTLLGTLHEEKDSVLSNLKKVRKTARADRQSAQEERSSQISTWNTTAQTANAASQSGGSMLAAQKQSEQAQEEKNKVVLQFITTAQNNLYQQLGSMYDTNKQGQQNDLRNLDDSQFQRRG